MNIKRPPIRIDYTHRRRSKISDGLKEIVFGAEDGMVSTLGALTGIAIGTADQFTVILAGLVIVAVESTGMSVGSFLSNKSASELDKRKLVEESEEVEKYPQAEKKELAELFIKDGWPNELSRQMAEVASQDKNLILKEMAYRELDIAVDKPQNLYLNAMFMFFSYILGGAIPVLPYLFLNVAQGIFVSVIITLLGLFGLGVATTKFTKRNWLKSGLEMLILASVAAAIGYIIGTIADNFR